MINRKNLLGVVAQALSGSRGTDSNERNHLFHDGYIFSWSRALSVLGKLPEGCGHLEGVVNSDILYNLLSKLPKRVEEISIDVVAEESKWVITCDGSTAEINLGVDESLVERFDTMNPKDLVWHDLPGKFYEGLAICDIPGNRYAFKGICIRDAVMLSVGGMRFHRSFLDSSISDAFASDTPENEKMLFISDFSVSEMLRSGTRFNQFAVTDNWVYFRYLVEDDAPMLFACNRLDSSRYPFDAAMGVYDKVEKAGGIGGTFPPMLESLDLASVFDTTVIQSTKKGVNVENNNVISLTFGKNNITVSSERSAVGKYSNRIPYPDGVKLDIESPFRVRITAPFLKEALKSTKDFRLVDVSGSTVLLMQGPFFTTIINTI